MLHQQRKYLGDPFWSLTPQFFHSTGFLVTCNNDSSQQFWPTADSRMSDCMDVYIHTASTSQKLDCTLQMGLLFQSTC